MTKELVDEVARVSAELIDVQRDDLERIRDSLNRAFMTLLLDEQEANSSGIPEWKRAANERIAGVRSALTTLDAYLEERT